MAHTRIDFARTEIPVLFRRLLLPTLVGMLFSAVFIITVGIFVGRGIGPDALAAVNLVSPLYMLSTGAGLMLGAGGSVAASMALARRKRRRASTDMTHATVVSAAAMIALTVLLLASARTVVRLLGTPPELESPVSEYMRYFVLFFSFNTLLNVLMFFVRLDGAPGFAMRAIATAAVINIGLDYLFIFVHGWGMAGAAVATGLGNVAGTLMMLRYLGLRSKTLRFRPVRPGGKRVRYALRNAACMARLGFPALLGELAIACMMLAGNFAFIRHTGKDGVAAFSVVCYFFPIIFMVFNAIVQSAQPIISYNCGAGMPERTRKTLRLALRWAVSFSLLLFAATLVGNERIVSLFIEGDSPARRIAVQGMPYFAAGYPFFGINMVAVGYYQSLGRARLSTVFMLLRGIVLPGILFFTLPLWLGLAGIWLAVPAAEGLTSVLIAACARMKR